MHYPIILAWQAIASYWVLEAQVPIRYVQVAKRFQQSTRESEIRSSIERLLAFHRTGKPSPDL